MTSGITQIKAITAIAVESGGGGGTPGGLDTQVQFNDGGVFGGDAAFTFDKTTGTVSLGKLDAASTSIFRDDMTLTGSEAQALVLINPTTSTLGNPQESPVLDFNGNFFLQSANHNFVARHQSIIAPWTSGAQIKYAYNIDILQGGVSQGGLYFAKKGSGTLSKLQMVFSGDADPTDIPTNPYDFVITSNVGFASIQLINDDSVDEGMFFGAEGNLGIIYSTEGPFAVYAATDGDPGNYDGILFCERTNITVGVGAAGVDYQISFNGQTNDGSFQWMEDEDYFRFNDDVHLPDGENLVLATTTGSKIGTAATQKIGFWNATPVVQSTGWTMTNVTSDKVLDANSTTLDEVADVLGTLVDTLKTYGILGA